MYNEVITNINTNKGEMMNSTTVKGVFRELVDIQQIDMNSSVDDCIDKIFPHIDLFSQRRYLMSDATQPIRDIVKKIWNDRRYKYETYKNKIKAVVDSITPSNEFSGYASFVRTVNVYLTEWKKQQGYVRPTKKPKPPQKHHSHYVNKIFNRLKARGFSAYMEHPYDPDDLQSQRADIAVINRKTGEVAFYIEYVNCPAAKIHARIKQTSCQQKVFVLEYDEGIDEFFSDVKLIKKLKDLA